MDFTYNYFKKTLNANVLKIKFSDYYNTNDCILTYEDDIIKYNESEFEPYSNENYFEDMNSVVYKNDQVNLLGNTEKVEVPYLSNDTIYKINDANNLITSKSSIKTIRKTQEKTYYIKSTHTTESTTEKNIKKLDKTIEEV